MKVSKDRSIAFAWFGFIGVAAFAIALICAEAIDTTWQFGVNYLSDLGISETDASSYFNTGCLIAGILLAVFGIGRAAFPKNAGHIAGGVLIVFGSIAFALIGVYTSDTGDTHTFLAYTAVLFVFMAIVAVTVGNWIADRKVFAGVGVIVVLMLAAMALAYDAPKFEAYGIVLAMIWFVVEGINMIISSEKN